MLTSDSAARWLAILRSIPPEDRFAFIQELDAALPKEAIVPIPERSPEEQEECFALFANLIMLDGVAEADAVACARRLALMVKKGA